MTLPISCNGATWDNVLNVKSEYTHGYMTGGPIGFSTDIASYPSEEKQLLKKHIAQYKIDREFYKNATMRILYDSDNLTAIEYADTKLEKIVIQVFTNLLNQTFVTIYPAVNKEKHYLYDGKLMLGELIAENGIKVYVSDIDCKEIQILQNEE